MFIYFKKVDSVLLDKKAEVEITLKNKKKYYYNRSGSKCLE